MKKGSARIANSIAVAPFRSPMKRRNQGARERARGVDAFSLIDIAPFHHVNWLAQKYMGDC